MSVCQNQILRCGFHFFIAKMIGVALGMANVLTLRILRGQGSEMALTYAKPPLPIRLAAGLSLVTWLTALTLGRLVGYF